MCDCLRVDLSGSQVHLETCPWHNPSSCIACLTRRTWAQPQDPVESRFLRFREGGEDTAPSPQLYIGRCDDENCLVCKALASV